MTSGPGASRLLTQHFLRRLLDNDLISPHADRHEAIAMTSAALISTSVFISVLLSAKYLMSPFPTPAVMALVSLDDKLLFVSASMMIMALVALVEWDALPLDARDASILGPLPVRRGAFVRAKLGALVLFAGGFATLLNAGASVLYPLFFAARMPLRLVDIATLLVTHFLVTMAAGAFGLLLIVAIRELLRAGLGARLFLLVSTPVQAVLVVGCVTALLMLPVWSSRVASWTLVPPTSSAHLVPPFWFVGLYETGAGDVLDALPRPRVPPRIAAREREATVIYRSRRGMLRAAAGLALTGLGLLTIVGVGAFAWNNRRLPTARAVRVGRLARRHLGAALAQRLVARRAAVQAGFFFTVQTLPRSTPHRLALATAFALGLALVSVGLRGVEVQPAADGARGALALWSTQTIFLVVVLTGFRHAARIPAHPHAGWTFHLAWSGDERAYVAGVKRAGLAMLALPVLLLLVPFHVMAFGPRLAVAHFLFGLILAHILVDALFLGLRQPPFACNYRPAVSLKKIAPIVIVAFYSAASALASLERAVLGGTFLLVMLGVATALRALDAWQRRTRVAVELDELPDPTTQRLDLSG